MKPRVECMKKISVVVLTVILSFLVRYASPASATEDAVIPTVAPAYDITGVWKTSGGGLTQFYQDGSLVYMVYAGSAANRGWGHYYTARYVSAGVSKNGL